MSKDAAGTELAKQPIEENRIELPEFQEPTSLEQAKSMIFELGANLSEHAYILGRILIWVKKKVGHGNFEKWIEANVWFQKSTAKNFMNFARKCLKLKYLLLYFPSKRQSLAISDFQPKIYDIWNFQARDPSLGDVYPGNIPGQIVQNVLYYYTEEGDLVVDPMAGGGVTIDCCKLMKRRCLAYDINPSRKEIKFNDILQGYPKEAIGCKLIFLDPPYYTKKKDDYGLDSISSHDLKQYWQDIRTMAYNSHRCLEPQGFLAFLMEPFIDYEQSRNSLWLYQYIDNFHWCNPDGNPVDNKPLWTVERIIDAPESSQRYAAHDVERAKKNKQILTLRRQLVVFRK